MIFSATFACARCRLRFARRAQCPSCGGAEIFSLTTREGRAGCGPAARTALGGGRDLRLRLAHWAPQRPLIPIGAGILAMVPAAVCLAIGPFMFQNLRFMDDLTTKYEGLSSRGSAIIAIAVGGAFLVAFTLLAKAGSAMEARAQASTPKRFRVFSPSEAARGDTTLTGIARRASVEIVSGVTEELCLLYGIRGEVGNADVADADGGDFDLELPSGERVMISLEHAMLVAPAPERAGERQDEIGSALAELLENRAIPDPEGRAVLDELLVCDGDELAVTGTLLGGTVTSLGSRGASGARVLAGDEERPLVVRASLRASERPN